MKKILIALLFILSFISCTKNSAEQCYNCQYDTINGYHRPDDIFCGDLSTYKPKDSQGNEWSFSCQKR